MNLRREHREIALLPSAEVFVCFDYAFGIGHQQRLCDICCCIGEHFKCVSNADT